MTATSRTSTTSPGDPTATDPDAVRAEIDATRRALGDTVDALATKVDIKARVSAKLSERKQQLRLQRARLAHRIRMNPAPVAGAVAAMLAVLGSALFWRRRHRG